MLAAAELTEAATDAWHDCFVATAGATAALAGLVFVAVSINIERILALQGAPERGLQTVIVLLSALVVSVFVLFPQSSTSLGIETLALGLGLLLFMTITVRSTLAGVRGHPNWVASRVFLTIPGTVPYVVAGIILIADASFGIAWIAAGVIGAIVTGVTNAWVLLVEILR